MLKVSYLAQEKRFILFLLAKIYARNVTEEIEMDTKESSCTKETFPASRKLQI